METTIDISITPVKHSRLLEPGISQKEFGRLTSDHMFVCKYENGEWQQPEIKPFSEISISPTALALHYGQSIFEGMKAFRMVDGKINIFRIDKHHERINRSLARMCMPEIPEEFFFTALTELVSLDKAWVPSDKDCSLYIRPFVFASEAKFGMSVSNEYHFIIFTGPVKPVYSRPLKVKVEREFIRSAKGGTGYAKCCGNYGGALYPTKLAQNAGYDQVLWTDARDHEYLEESGITNIMLVISGSLITPSLSDSILDGITRDSMLRIARDMHIPVEERRISVTELREAFENKSLTEAFCVGTGAVVVPISIIGIDERNYEVPAQKEGSVMNRLKTKLDALRYGQEEDVYGWNNVVG